VLNDASALPPEPVDDLAETRAVVHPALGRSERMTNGSELLRVPERAQDVPCKIKAVLRDGVVVLDNAKFVRFHIDN
jgi:hypothetical protein